jgi:toxin ParE1/3/4
MRLRWLPAAARNRFEQLNYIAQYNPYAAIRLDEEIEKQTNQLQTFPELGKVGRVQTTRELMINRTPFVLIYRILDNEVQLLRLLRHEQQWP